MSDFQYTIEYLLTLTHGTDIRRWWTGENDLSFDGQSYEGTATDKGGSFINITPIERTAGTPNIRGTITMAVTNETFQRMYQQDRGIVSAKVVWIWLDGRAWRQTGQSFDGFLSHIRMQDGLLTAEIETVRGGAFPQQVNYWSHEEQQRNYPGDLFFEFAEEIEKGIEVQW